MLILGGGCEVTPRCISGGSWCGGADRFRQPFGFSTGAEECL